jgi:hypothetical protein
LQANQRLDFACPGLTLNSSPHTLFQPIFNFSGVSS